MIESVKTEATILSNLDHPNVIKVKHLIQLNAKYFLGMQYLPGATLQTFLKTKFRNDGKLADTEAAQLMKGLLHGVVYLHQKGIIPRDLKPQNILIDDFEDLTTVKLIDFGLGQQNTRFK